MTEADRALAQPASEEKGAVELITPDPRHGLQGVLAALYRRGVDLDWRALAPAGATRPPRPPRRRRLPGHPSSASAAGPPPPLP
ncbi:hypothetical protein DI273_01345 [Streptomyces violascens]|nr:hypothetical protein DI273_01345 [Streptomyces violascens]